ncbi:hypothetical protein DRJ22_01825 [Candidatus Woesearchaeota archaeon]|nr:MAG: hypothetical protein B6U93_02330 [Candidatus Woesearchaeota archaeon ex4484_78]RLE46492.1 MAG: hypothetical protein DRJ22_01825 [Candidatus Woesearchaeota archaeon]
MVLAFFKQLALANPLVFYSIICVVSLLVVLRAADLALYGISNYAKKLGVSQYLIGFLVVSVGTSLPELVAAITGAVQKQTALIMGTILGSNISDLTLILGVLVIVGKTIKLEEPVVGKTFFRTVLLVLLPLVLVLDGRLSRLDGFVLVSGFIAYIASLWIKEGKLGKMKKSVKLRHIWRDGAVFVGCIIALLLGARWLILSASSIASIVGISPYVVGLTLVALGTSLPELTVEIRSVLKGLSSLAFGDLIGSVIANSTLVLGLVAIISPFVIDPLTIVFASAVMVFSLFLGLYFMSKRFINWKQGVVLVAVYVVFFVCQFV